MEVIPIEFDAAIEEIPAAFTVVKLNGRKVFLDLTDPHDSAAYDALWTYHGEQRAPTEQEACAILNRLARAGRVIL